MATEFEAKVLLTAEEFVEILTKHDSYMVPKNIKQPGSYQIIMK